MGEHICHFLQSHVFPWYRGRGQSQLRIDLPAQLLFYAQSHLVMLTDPHSPWGRATMTPPPPFWSPHHTATPAYHSRVLFPVVSDVETSNWSRNQQPFTSLDQQSGHLLAWLEFIGCPMQSHTEGCVGPAPKNVDPLTDQHLWATFACGQEVAVAVNTRYLLGIAVLMYTLCDPTPHLEQ